ncbi:MAG: DJ-1/PfpI family protein [Vicinamibacteria bacterium]
MDTVSRRSVLRVVGTSVLGLGVTGHLISQPSGKEYVCPPCTCGRDHEVFARPGTCPGCGMVLVEKGAAVEPPTPAAGVRAAVLIFDGVQVIDFAAPYEVFGQAGYEVFTVAVEVRPVLTSMGLRVTPRYSLAEAPAADVVLVPGGEVGGAEGDARVLEWLRKRAETATHVVSVCNGAFILAAAGLLDGLTATTFYDLLESLKTRAPKTTVVSDRRFVDNGKVITTAGLSSGIDGALHVVSKISGSARAQMAALNMEYDWKSDARYARASFADAPIRRLFGRSLALPLAEPDRAVVAATNGDAARWEVVWSITTSRPVDAVVQDAAAAIQQRGQWTRTGDAGPGSTRAAWNLTDAGSAFRAELAAGAEAGGVRLSLRLERL